MRTHRGFLLPKIRKENPMIKAVLVVLTILALLEIVLLNGVRLFFMVASAVQETQGDKYPPPEK